jgi:choline dehydrogenase-like flavoprotein
MHVHPPVVHNKTNQKLIQGADNLGYFAKECGQNSYDEVHDCGWCCFGCKYQHKQGTNNSFLPISINQYGTKVLTNCCVNKILFDSKTHWNQQVQNVIKQSNQQYVLPERIEMPAIDLNHRFNPQYLTDNEKTLIPHLTSSYSIPSTSLPYQLNDLDTTTQPIATGVEVIYTPKYISVIPDSSNNFRQEIENKNKLAIKLKINAKIIVSSCGSLQTPLLLNRSNIKHQEIGNFLRLHPVAGVGAIYPELIETWKGAPMTTVCEVVKNRKDGYGSIIETPSVHSALLSFALAWQGMRQFKQITLQMDHIAPFICLTRDMTSYGYVREGHNGKALVDYSFTQFDRESLLEGVIHACKMHAAAGATTIISPFFAVDTIEGIDPELRHCDPKFIHWLEKIKCHGIWTHGGPLFSAHQMGSCRLSSHNFGPLAGPVKINGEVKGYSNVFVSDASLFPTASGVNPMITTMTVAQYVALNIQQRLHRLKCIENNLQQNGFKF